MRKKTVAFKRTLNSLFQNADQFDNPEAKDIFDSCVEIALTKEDFLNHHFMCDIGIDTGDARTDFMDNTVYPAYGAVQQLYQTEHPSIIWLALQQGHKRGELYKALRWVHDYKKSDTIDSPFIRSAVREIRNEVTECNPLFFFTYLTGEQLLNLNSLFAWQYRSNKWAGYIVLDKTTSTGFYDNFVGGCSSIGIALEKNVKIPMKYIWCIVPDSYFYYPMQGIIESKELWKENLLYINYPKHFRKIMNDIGLNPIEKNASKDFLQST